MLSYIIGEEKWKNLSKNLKKLIFMPSHIIGEIKIENVIKIINFFTNFLKIKKQPYNRKKFQNYYLYGFLEQIKHLK